MDSRLIDPENFAEIAMYHFYFVEAVLEHIKNEPSIIEFFNIGQDDFIMELTVYSYSFYLTVDDAFLKEGALPGVAQFELPETLAIIFWEQCNIQEGLFPPKDTFKQAVFSLCEDWQARDKRGIG